MGVSTTESTQMYSKYSQGNGRQKPIIPDKTINLFHNMVNKEFDMDDITQYQNANANGNNTHRLSSNINKRYENNINTNIKTNLKSQSSNIPKKKIQNIENIDFECLDDEVKSRMMSKITNLKNTWDEFLNFEKYHKVVFSKENLNA
jgi:hypothetical protein